MWHIFFSQDVRVVQNLPTDCTLYININIFNGFIILKAILQILCDTYLAVAVARFIDQYVCG
jgi:hypothetical protein